MREGECGVRSGMFQQVWSSLGCALACHLGYSTAGSPYNLMLYRNESLLLSHSWRRWDKAVSKGLRTVRGPSCAPLSPNLSLSQSGVRNSGENFSEAIWLGWMLPLPSLAQCCPIWRHRDKGADSLGAAGTRAASLQCKLWHTSLHSIDGKRLACLARSHWCDSPPPPLPPSTLNVHLPPFLGIKMRSPEFLIFRLLSRGEGG